MTSLKPNFEKQEAEMINYDHFNLLMYNENEIVKNVQYVA